MKCVKCRGPAAIELRRHNSGFCSEHFLEYFENQVRRAIAEFRMFGPEERVLVAVSGGKDSLALWDVLLRMGYQVDGLYIDLGIGEYSAESRARAEEFAARRGVRLIVHSVAGEYGAAVPDLARLTGRVACSACGLTKRHTFNKTARQYGYDVVATGHNLDDEAAVLLGNVLHWETGYLGRQSPAMPAEDGFARKVKPLYRVTERETAAYAVLRGIDYIVEECPNARGAQSLVYKELLNRLEQESPGSKHHFLFGFYQIRPEVFRSDREQVDLRPCTRCGEPTTGEICAFCRLLERAGLHQTRLPG